LSGAGPPVPPDDILEDDVALDDYIEDWQTEMKRQARKNKQSNFESNK
jgi:hypothetical protein